MVPALLTGAAILWALATPATALAQTTMADIVKWCSNYPDPSGNDRLCNLYVGETVNLLRSTDPVIHGGQRVCVPTDTPVARIVPIFMSWVEANRQAMSPRLIENLAAALKDRYPCP